MTRRYGLDLLRAVAIGFVLLQHGFWFLSPFESTWFWNIQAGYIGVELFFVLSGYLVGGLALDAGATLGSFRGLTAFWSRRWLRTLPNYVLFVVVIWFVAGALGRWRPDSPLPWFTFTQNLAWPVPYWFRASWSLAIEEWFYLLFPLGLGWLVWRAAPVRRAAGLLIGLAIVVPLLLRIAAVELHNSSFWDTRHIVALHGDPIAWGVLAAAVHRWYPTVWRWLHRAMPLAVVGLVALMVWFGLGDGERWAARTFLPTAVSVCIALILPWLSAWRVADSFGTEFVRSIARWSYSIYLVDGVVYPVMFLVWPGFPGTRLEGVLFMLLFWVACITAAAWVYRLWEKPWMDLRDRSIRWEFLRFGKFI